MYSYNSTHKIFVVLLVIGWAVFQFSGNSEESLYYDNGQVRRVGNQLNSLNEGTWTWYFENGKVQLNGSFHEGNREGEWNTYDSLGNLLTTSTYVENRINGSFYRYGANGEIAEEHIYKNDTLIEKVK